MTSTYTEASPFDDIVDKACSSKEEDWGVIMDICDKVSAGSNGPKNGLTAIVKKIRAGRSNEKCGLMALVVLTACVNNGGDAFRREIDSSQFQEELCRLLEFKAGMPVGICKKLKEQMFEWEKDFKSSLKGLSKTIEKLRKEGYDFPGKPALNGASNRMGAKTKAEEEAEFAAAIAASLKDAPKNSASMYPSSAESKAPPKSDSGKKTVIALYEFEAKEEGELGFKEGDVITVLDDSHPDWWKGEFKGWTGLFPANFVEVTSSMEKTVGKKTASRTQSSNLPVEINVDKLDLAMEMLGNADPTSRNPEELQTIDELYKECMGMRKTIKAKYDETETNASEIFKLNERLCAALALYDKEMKEAPRRNVYYGQVGSPGMAPQGGQRFYGREPSGSMPMQNGNYMPANAGGPAPPNSWSSPQQPQQQNIGYPATQNAPSPSGLPYNAQQAGPTGHSGESNGYQSPGVYAQYGPRGEQPPPVQQPQFYNP
eukprot:Nk52_evm37s229 gene=Nk52_evmTU37s229